MSSKWEKLMKQYRKLLLVLGCSVSVTLVFTTSLLSAQELVSPAAAFTVRVDTPRDGDGSGVLMAKDGNAYYVLTAWHVVNGQGPYTIYTHDNVPHEVTLNQVDRISGYDLAVLQFNSNRVYVAANISPRQPVQDQRVVVSGWLNPLIEIQNTTHQSIIGNLTGYLNPPNEDGYSLTFSAPGAFQGMSGGPVLDEDSRIIGIIGQAAHDIEGPVGIYLGIPISVFLNSGYGQYVQNSQYSGSREPGEEGPYYPTPGEKPRLSSSDPVFFPAPGEPPRISR
jgi:serine protease Do